MHSNIYKINNVYVISKKKDVDKKFSNQSKLMKLCVINFSFSVASFRDEDDDEGTDSMWDKVDNNEGLGKISRQLIDMNRK
jgi:hypothetical protein